MSQAPTADSLTAAITLLFDAYKVMLPVITGFTVLFGSSLAKLWEGKKVLVWGWAGLTLCLSIFSLGIWSGVMPFCIIASLGKPYQLFFILGPYEPHTMFQMARWCARLGHTGFFFAVVCSCVFYWKTIHRSEPGSR